MGNGQAGRRAERRGGLPAFGVLLAVLLLAACSSPRHRAPVETRGNQPQPVQVVPPPSPAASAAVAAAPPPAPVEAPLPAGSYTVKAGDTLIRIGLDAGQNWRDIARWNGLTPPYPLEVGQVLRVAPPRGEPAVVAAAPVVGAIKGEPPRSPDARPGATEPAPAAAVPAAPASDSAPRDPDENVNWQWPAPGAVITPFDNTRSKGLSIAGQAGDPVLAAADGRVVYAGSGLRGYGNLVIVKHNNTYLTAYAHNQALLVKEDQVVRRGQKIAEMGSSDADRVQLHFEIRRQGKPVDPARYLPPR
ncbi:MAG: peptidoglycan DD-metalloendopeptidase family protein [Rubrivivax sp.]|nr:peptidoglycan DD-metalloendopeptidase family protein [Rubrivivax sp.]